LCFYPKDINSKSAAKLSIMEIMSTPWGASKRARDWRGGAIAGGHRPRKRRNPRKARFPVQPEMRPNEVLKKLPVSVITLQVEAL
jgi:hypothetical protein